MNTIRNRMFFNVTSEYDFYQKRHYKLLFWLKRHFYNQYSSMIKFHDFSNDFFSNFHDFSKIKFIKYLMGYSFKLELKCNFFGESANIRKLYTNIQYY